MSLPKRFPSRVGWEGLALFLAEIFRLSLPFLFSPPSKQFPFTGLFIRKRPHPKPRRAEGDEAIPGVQKRCATICCTAFVRHFMFLKFTIFLRQRLASSETLFVWKEQHAFVECRIMWFKVTGHHFLRHADVDCCAEWHRQASVVFCFGPRPLSLLLLTWASGWCNLFRSTHSELNATYIVYYLSSTPSWDFSWLLLIFYL